MAQESLIGPESSPWDCRDHCQGEGGEEEEEPALNSVSSRRHLAVGKRRKDDQPAGHGDTEHRPQVLPNMPETHEPAFDDLVLPLPPQTTSTHVYQATQSLYRRPAALSNRG
jgi:hypothetical protein